METEVFLLLAVLVLVVTDGFSSLVVVPFCGGKRTKHDWLPGFPAGMIMKVLG